jgi:hypothetical protein
VRLAGTSAWVWTRAVGGSIRAGFDADVVAGEVATCAIVKLELLYSARNPAEFIALGADLDSLPDCPIGTEQPPGSADRRRRRSRRCPDSALRRGLRPDRRNHRAARRVARPTGHSEAARWLLSGWRPQLSAHARVLGWEHEINP